MSSKNSPHFAFLGPAGSYTELALAEHIKPAKSKACYSIAEVFRMLESGEISHGFVPIENIIGGPVTETLDLLFEYRNRVYIEQSFVSDIEHCLGLLPGKESLEKRKLEITQILSREQALRQCSKYIRSSFPAAQLCPTASSGEAAKLVKEKSLLSAAVIAAKQTLLSLGFEIAEEDIADIPGNKTRFVLLRAGNINELLNKDPQEGISKRDGTTERLVTSIVIDPGRDRQGLLFEILEVISIQHQVNLLSIHSRPDSRGGFVFHFDVEGHFSEKRIQDCLQGLHEYTMHSTSKTAEVTVCGSYKRTRFHKLPFHTIGILGGEGKMGRWFTEFFRQVGFKVLISDLESNLSLKELAVQADVILLSIPMSQVVQVLPDLCSQLQSQQLVVENCSIKSCILPQLLSTAPQEVEVLGIHTMFGASAESIRGENVIITKTERSAHKAQAFEDLLYKHGAKITYADMQQHDKNTAVLQSLIHLLMIALAEVRRNSFDSKDQCDPYSTPNSRVIFQTMEKVFSQSEELLFDLQTLNEEYPAIRKEFVETLLKLSSALDKKDAKQFIELAEQSKRFLGLKK